MSAKMGESRNRTWRLLPWGVLRAAENMAVDESVFRLNVRDHLPPTIRFYGWHPPAVSLGYFQKSAREIDLDACRREGIDIVRRPTGGKAVLHAHELTYSFVAAADHPLFTGDILGTYRVIGACIVETLRRLGLSPEMVSDGRSAAGTPMEAYCFAAPSKYEILVNGRKICGSAQVRTGQVFLQHGSLLIDIDPVRTAAAMKVSADEISATTTTLLEQTGRIVAAEELAGIFRGAVEDSLGVILEEGGLTDAEEALKRRMMKEKYNSDSWNLDGKVVPGGDEPAD